MVVPVGKKVRILTTAADVIHAWFVPELAVKQDAIPGRVISGWFKATQTGSFDVQCAEICGIGHALMPAKVFVESPEAHAEWLAHPTQYLAYTQK